MGSVDGGGNEGGDIRHKLRDLSTREVHRERGHDGHSHNDNQTHRPGRNYFELEDTNRGFSDNKGRFSDTYSNISVSRQVSGRYGNDSERNANQSSSRTGNISRQGSGRAYDSERNANQSSSRTSHSNTYNESDGKGPGPSRHHDHGSTRQGKNNFHKGNFSGKSSGPFNSSRNAAHEYDFQQTNQMRDQDRHGDLDYQSLSPSNLKLNSNSRYDDRSLYYGKPTGPGPATFETSSPRGRSGAYRGYRDHEYESDYEIDRYNHRRGEHQPRYNNRNTSYDKLQHNRSNRNHESRPPGPRGHRNQVGDLNRNRYYEASDDDHEHHDGKHGYRNVSKGLGPHGQHKNHNDFSRYYESSDDDRKGPGGSHVKGSQYRTVAGSGKNGYTRSQHHHHHDNENQVPVRDYDRADHDRNHTSSKSCSKGGSHAKGFNNYTDRDYSHDHGHGRVNDSKNFAKNGGFRSKGDFSVQDQYPVGKGYSHHNDSSLNNCSYDRREGERNRSSHSGSGGRYYDNGLESSDHHRNNLESGDHLNHHSNHQNHLNKHNLSKLNEGPPGSYSNRFYNNRDSKSKDRVELQNQLGRGDRQWKDSHNRNVDNSESRQDRLTQNPKRLSGTTSSITNRGAETKSKNSKTHLNSTHLNSDTLGKLTQNTKRMSHNYCQKLLSSYSSEHSRTEVRSEVKSGGSGESNCISQIHKRNSEEKSLNQTENPMKSQSQIKSSSSSTLNSPPDPQSKENFETLQRIKSSEQPQNAVASTLKTANNSSESGLPLREIRNQCHTGQPVQDVTNSIEIPDSEGAGPSPRAFNSAKKLNDYPPRNLASESTKNSNATEPGSSGTTVTGHITSTTGTSTTGTGVTSGSTSTTGKDSQSLIDSATGTRGSLSSGNTNLDYSAAPAARPVQKGHSGLIGSAGPVGSDSQGSQHAQSTVTTQSTTQSTTGRSGSGESVSQSETQSQPSGPRSGYTTYCSTSLTQSPADVGANRGEKRSGHTTYCSTSLTQSPA